MRYQRATAAGGTYFFTVNLADRHADTLVRHIDELRTVTRSVKQAHPFDLLAMVVLPEHLHTIWRLPPGDANFALRWSLFKSGFSLDNCPAPNPRTPADSPNENAASGSAATGNIRSAMKPISSGMSTTSISIR